MGDLRFRTATARLLRVFLAAPELPRFGLELCAAAELPSGVLYPLLAQLERGRWIQGAWEPSDPLAVDRRPRRYYSLTADGFDFAHEAFESVDACPAPPPIRPVSAPQTQLDYDQSPLVGAVPAALLLLAQLRLPAPARPSLYREWSAELDYLLRRVTVRRLRIAAGFALGLVAASARVARDIGPTRASPPTDPLTMRAARRRLKLARRAWDAAARRHTFIDADLDPMAEVLALHTALYCQLEVDDAELSYGVACAIAAFEQGIAPR